MLPVLIGSRSFTMWTTAGIWFPSCQKFSKLGNHGNSGCFIARDLVVANSYAVCQTLSSVLNVLFATAFLLNYRPITTISITSSS